MTQRVLLTGGTGFVGAQVLRALAEKGCRITLVTRPNRVAEARKLEGVDEVIESADLFKESAAWWQSACDGVDTIIHAAWYAEPGKYLTSPLNLQCLAGTLALAQGAVDAGVKRLVGVGTCFEYDLSGGVLSTDTPLRPITPYAGAKAATFEALSTWLPTQSVSFAWCRLFYLFGEGEDARRLVPYLRMKLAAGEVAELTSGRQIRDFIDVAQAGRQIADVALSDVTGALNICSGTPITVRQLAERIADESGRRDLLKFGARPDNLVDPPCVVGVPYVPR